MAQKLTGECIWWTGTVNDRGYGRDYFRFPDGKQRTLNAHRVAWLRAFGPYPKGLDVLHLCDNRLCVNIHHLALGTRGANVRDMIQKGRMFQQRGSKHGLAKLTEDDVRIIKSMLPNNSDSAIARHYNVSAPCIRSIRIGRTWGHITEEKA